MKEKVIFSEAELKKIKLIKEKLQLTDFGKLRQDVVSQVEKFYPVAENLAVEIVENPIVFANIVNVFPPLINNLIKLISTTLSRIDLPSEILASAVFNLLSDLEAEEFGRCINELARLINGIHEGSLILDKDEPRFREVAESFLERVTTPFDHEAFPEAAVAFCDNTEILCQVLTDIITEKPEFFQSSLSSLLLASNTLVRGLDYALEKAGTLPPPLFEYLAQELREKVDYKELGKLINSLLFIANRLLEENPALFEESLNTFFKSVDKELLKKVVRGLSRQSIAAISRQGMFDFLSPEEAGKAVNSLIFNYNRSLSESPQKIEHILSSYLQEVETQELAEAMVKSSSQIASVLANNPTLSRALIKSSALILGGAIKGCFRSFFVRK